MAVPPHASGRERDPQAIAQLAARAALDKQAEAVVIMDLRTLSTVADVFLVCTAGSARQLAAIKDHLETVLAKRGWPVWHAEGVARRPAAGNGSDEPQWLLMDCGDLIIHLFDQRARAFYRLEDLWADAPRIPVDAGA